MLTSAHSSHGSTPAYLAEIAPSACNGVDLDSMHGAEAAALIEGVPDERPHRSAGRQRPADRGGRAVQRQACRLGRSRASSRSSAERCASCCVRVSMPTWEALWIARDILAELPEAPSVATRWDDDLARLHSARRLHRERRTSSVRSTPRAGRRSCSTTGRRHRHATRPRRCSRTSTRCSQRSVEGQAIVGDVINVDTDNRELGPSGKSMTARPLITLAIADPCPFPDRHGAVVDGSAEAARARRVGGALGVRAAQRSS